MAPLWTSHLADLLAAEGASPLLVLAVLLLDALVSRRVSRYRSRTAPVPLRFDNVTLHLSGVAVSLRPDPLVATEWPHGTLLARLDPDARTELLGLGVRRRVAAGQILLHQGAEGSHLVLLRHGLTKVTASHPDGRTTLLAIRFGGDLVGEMSALNRRPRSATVTACGPAVVSIIQEQQFKLFLRTHPEAALEVAAMVADRLRWSNQRRIEFTSCPARVRVARIIAELARSHGHRTPDGVVIDIHLTQPELATACGASDTTIEKTLRQLRTDGIVETDYRRITIRDLTRLWQVCGYDPIDNH